MSTTTRTTDTGHPPAPVSLHDEAVAANRAVETIRAAQARRAGAV